MTSNYRHEFYKIGTVIGWREGEAPAEPFCLSDFLSRNLAPRLPSLDKEGKPRPRVTAGVVQSVAEKLNP